MLRRSKKLAASAGGGERTGDSTQPVLGLKRTNDVRDVDALEAVVFGGQHDIVEKLRANEDPSSNRERRKRKKQQELHVELKPVWEDDDPTIDKEEKKRILNTTEKWARLPAERSDDEVTNSDDSEKSDVEDDGIDASTGTCLGKSVALPSGILQIKKIKDVNSDRPAKGKLRSIEFHPSAQVILTAGMDQTLRLFQVDGKHNPVIQSIFLETFPIYSAHFSHGGREVILGSRHSAFYYYDMIAGKVVKVPKIKAMDGCGTKRFEVSPDGRYLAFFGNYGHIHLLTAQSKEWVGSVKMNGDVSAVSFSSDGCKMFSHGAGNEVYVWDIRQLSCSHVFIDDGCATSGTSLAISPGDKYLATGSESGVVNIYDLSTCLQHRKPQPLKAIQNLTTACTSMKFNASSEILAIASDMEERAVKLVHVPSLTVFSNFPERSDLIRTPICLDWSLNSGYLSIGNHRGQALLYRLKHYSSY